MTKQAIFVPNRIASW